MPHDVTRGPAVDRVTLGQPRPDLTSAPRKRVASPWPNIRRVARISWRQALSWRLGRHLLEPVGDLPTVEVARRLLGVQAQVASSAEMAIHVRQLAPRRGEVAAALAGGTLIKTWAMRGTLHLLPADDAGAYLSLLADGRSWETPAWERYFGVSAAQMQDLRPVVRDALDGRTLTRDELIAEVTQRSGFEHLGEALRSGWGTLLKPLAWHGDICFGPSQGQRVTFGRPEQLSRSWRGVPPADEAAPAVIRSYLGAYGPATAEHVSNWVSRGAVRKRRLRSWFASLGDEVVQLEIDGESMYCRAQDADDIASAKPSHAVRLLPGFDQWVLGPGTDDTHVIPAGHRAAVSRQAGWIAPLVVVGGVVAGTWRLESDRVAIEWFSDEGRPAARALSAEVVRLAKASGRQLTL